MAKLTTLKENCLKVVIDNIGLFIKDSTIIQLSSLRKKKFLKYARKILKPDFICSANRENRFVFIGD